MSIYLSVDPKFLGIEEKDQEDIKLVVDGKTVGECLGQYLATKPDLKKTIVLPDGKVDRNTYVFINKDPVFADHLAKEVHPGDEVRFQYAEMHGC